VTSHGRGVTGDCASPLGRGRIPKARDIVGPSHCGFTGPDACEAVGSNILCVPEEIVLENVH